MALDSTLFAADIPAGTYAVGDIVNLTCIDGPANVRSGRGEAKLKSILVGQFLQQFPFWRVHVKNSDWIDDTQSISAGLFNSTTAFDEESGSIQRGHDCALTQNSGWQIYAECVVGGTSTSANSVFALIDVDYPQVSSVTDPASLTGNPVSMAYDVDSCPVQAYGAMVGSTWTVANVDYFKAGYKYVLEAVELATSSGAMLFVAFSNAAGMGGLQRIIPVNNQTLGIKFPIHHASILQKGPMDIKIKAFQASTGTVTVNMVHDFVRKAN